MTTDGRMWAVLAQSRACLVVSFFGGSRPPPPSENPGYAPALTSKFKVLHVMIVINLCDQGVSVNVNKLFQNMYVTLWQVNGEYLACHGGGAMVPSVPSGCATVLTTLECGNS